MTMQLILSPDSREDITHAWLHARYVESLSNGDMEAMRTYNAIGLIAFGERDSIETQLGAVREVRLRCEWTAARLDVLNQLINELELALLGASS